MLIEHWTEYSLPNLVKYIFNTLQKVSLLDIGSPPYYQQIRHYMHVLLRGYI